MISERMGNFFLLPGVLDFVQVANGEKPEIDLVYLLFAFIPGMVGFLVRAGKESSEGALIKKTRGFFIFFCSIATSLSMYLLKDVIGSVGLMSFFSLFLGVISVDIVNFMVTHLPKAFPQILMHYMKIKKDNNEDGVD